MAVEWITFHLTDRCQLDCSHCLRDPGAKPKDLALALVRRALEQAKAIYKSHHAAFTGGEPLLHPEFAAVLDTTVELGFTWHMVSNGKRLPWLLELFRQRPERQRAMTAITFSLDGATEAVHDAIRGAGSYREVLTACSLCVALNLPFHLQATLHAQNIAEIEALGLLAGQLGAKQMGFVMMQPTGTHRDRDFYLSANQWKGVIDRLQRLSTVLKMPVILPEGYHRDQPLHVCLPFTSQQLHISVEGDLTLCCQHAGIPSEGTRTTEAGNLANVSLPTAHRRLLEIIHTEQAEKIVALEAGALKNEWDTFPCNHCMKRFGKPHWTTDGVDGPPAQRQRWRGAWAKRTLPLTTRS